MPELGISDIARSQPKGAFAHRAGSASHFDDGLIGLTNKEATEEELQHDEEIAALASIASLKDHPGYQKMREARLLTISHYRSGAVLKAAMLDPEITNAKLGELARTTLLVADELDKELLTVEAASEAVEAEKAKKRSGRPKPDGA